MLNCRLRGYINKKLDSLESLSTRAAVAPVEVATELRAVMRPCHAFVHVSALLFIGRGYYPALEARADVTVAGRRQVSAEVLATTYDTKQRC